MIFALKNLTRWSQPLVLWLILTTCLQVNLSDAANTCPRKCQCIWRDSKITVDCSNQTLASIPSTVERNTQVLNISGNDIPIFGRAHFSRLGLINLQRVSCSRCNLTTVDTKAFFGLTNLVELDLAVNKLMEIPAEALNSEATALMSLSLRGNPIETIPTRAFHKLKYLTKLDLSDCHISTVSAGAFEGLESIQRIYLHNNHLSVISGRDLPPSLHEISVHDNSWECDCQLRSFRLWLTQSNVPRTVEPVCRTPRRLVGIRIQSLSVTEFACPPQLSPTSMFLTVPRGKNISIVCRVSSDPISKISWFFNGKALFDEDDSAKDQQGLYPPRTSELLLEEVVASTAYTTDVYGKSRIRVVRHDDPAEGVNGESRSELIIENAGVSDNGTYFCQAENKAARSISNFTLHITEREFTPDGPTILQLRLEHFIAAAISIIVILILVLIIVAILLIRVCKNRTSAFSQSEEILGKNPSSIKLGSVASLGSVTNPSVINGSKVAPSLSGKMPKHIQMGTGFVPNTKSSPGEKLSLPPGQTTISGILSQPDLLSDHNSSLTTSQGKKSNQTGNTSVASSSEISNGSYKAAMENIIHDYKLIPTNAPLIGEGQLPMTSSIDIPAALRSGGTLPRVTWAQNKPMTTFQGPQSLVYSPGSTHSELPLLENQQLTSSQMADYPEDFGLPKVPPPSRGSQAPDYAQMSSLLGRTSQSHSAWFTLPHQYQLDTPLYFATPKSQMLPDEKYPEQVVTTSTPLSVMNLPFSASIPRPHSSKSYFNQPANHIIGQNSGSKSLVLPRTSNSVTFAEDEAFYHSISGHGFDDESARNGGVPIYESIEHPTNQMTGEVHSYIDEVISGDYSTPHERGPSTGGTSPTTTTTTITSPEKSEMSESSKIELLYSKVNKRKSPPAKKPEETIEDKVDEPKSLLSSQRSTSSSPSSGSPPPLESVAPSRRPRRRSRQRSPTSSQARSSMALERLTKLLLSAPGSPPDDTDSYDDMLSVINQKTRGVEETLQERIAPMATSESSCAPTRGQTSAEEDENDSKNIDQELDNAFTSLDKE